MAARKKGRRVKLGPSRIKQLAKLFTKKVLGRLVKPIARKIKQVSKRRAAAKRKAEAPKVDQRHQLNASQWAETGRWVGVHSSNVAGIKYDSDRGLLFVEFLAKARSRSSVYVYYGVDENKAKAFFKAGSMGKYLHWQIKVKGYSYTRLR